MVKLRKPMFSIIVCKTVAKLSLYVLFRYWMRNGGKPLMLLVMQTNCKKWLAIFVCTLDARTKEDQLLLQMFYKHYVKT